MGVPRREIREWDDLPLSLEKSQYPPGAVSLQQNPDKTSRVIWLFLDANGNALCSAKRAEWTPENPIYCGGAPLVGENGEAGTGRCKKHGGTTATGILHHRFGKGRHTRSMPARLLARYKDALEDPDMHQLDKEIALIDAQIDTLLSKLGEYGGDEIFKDISTSFKALKLASKSGDKFKANEAFAKLEEVVATGHHEAYSWNTIQKLIEQRRKLVLAEAKRLQLTEQFVPVAKVNLLIFAMVDAVKEEITDKDVLERISQRLFRLIDQEGGSGFGERPSRPDQRYFQPSSEFVEGEFEETE